MSRTYRRKKDFYGHWHDLDWVLSETFYPDEFAKLDPKDFESVKFAWHSPHHGIVHRVTFKTTSKIGKQKIAKWHSDNGTWNFKEPGPSWFKRMTRTVPNRRHTKRELHKFMRREDYEPIVFDFLHKHTNYWT